MPVPSLAPAVHAACPYLRSHRLYMQHAHTPFQSFNDHIGCSAAGCFGCLGCFGVLVWSLLVVQAICGAGEMAILGGPRVGRQATVTALSKGALWCLHRDTFHRCKAQAPKSVSKLSTEEENFVVPTFGELPVKDVELIACLDKATSRSALFSQFRRDQRRRLFDLMDKQVIRGYGRCKGGSYG